MYHRSRQAFASGLPSVTERIEYRLVAGLSITVCLAFVTARRLFRTSPAAGNERQSIYREAHSAAMAAVGYAYTR